MEGNTAIPTRSRAVPSEQRNLTIVVPAFNEEHEIAAALKTVVRTADRHLQDYEIIVVDDGSRDRTGQIADVAATENPRIHVVHQPQNRGVGAAYLIGLARARFDAITVIPGDNVFSEIGVDRVFAAVGSAPLIVSYRENMELRKPLRRWLSLLCTVLMRCITGLRIRDAHSMFVFPVELARTLPIQPGYGYHIESLGRLLTLCPSFLEIPVTLNPRPDSSSGVMRTRVIALLGITMLRLAVWRARWLLREQTSRSVHEQTVEP